MKVTPKKESLNLHWTFVLAGTFLFSSVSDAALVWSQKDGSDNNIYYSSDEQHAIALTHSGNHHTPGLFVSAKDSFVTWVDNSSSHKSFIRLAKISGSEIIETETLPIPFKANTVFSPSIASDDQSTQTWLVWSQLDGETQDLWGVKKLDNHWSSPTRLTAKDAYSDGLAQITSVTGGSIEIQWIQSSRQDLHKAFMRVDSFPDKDKMIARERLFSQIDELRSSTNEASDTPGKLAIKRLSDNHKVWSATEHHYRRSPSRINPR